MALCGRRARLTRVLRRTLYVKLGLVFAILVLGLVVMVRLLAGPVSIRDYQARVSDSLASRLGPGWSVSLGDTEIELNGFRPAVRATELEIRNPAGVAVVRSPYGLVTLDPLALAVGALVPREIELRDLHLRALLAADGSLSFLPSSDAAPIQAATDRPEPAVPAVEAGAEPRPSAVSTALVSLIDPILDHDNLIGGIDKASLLNARLTLVGSDGRERVGFTRVSAVFANRGDAGRAIDLALEGPRGAWKVEGLVRDDGRSRRADLAATDVPIEDAMLLSGLAGLQGGSDLRLSGTLSAEVSGSRLADLRAQFDSTRGRIALPGQPAIAIDHAAGTASWDEARRVLALSGLNLRSGRTDVTLSGELAPHDRDGSELTLTGRDAKFSGVTDRDPPFSVAEIGAKLRFGEQAITLERLSLTGDDLNLSLAGQTYQTPAGTGLKGNVAADASGVRRLLRLWPEFINPELRGYLIANLKLGTVETLRIATLLDADELRNATSAKPISDGAMAMSFAMKGAQLHVADGMPDLTRLSVEGTASGTKTSLSARQGRFDLPEGRRLNFLDGSYNQVDLDKPMSAAKVAFRLEGGADALVAFLRQPIFRDVSSLDLNPSNVKGRADLKVGFPLDPHRVPPPGEMPVVISGALSDLALDKVFGREKLEGANLAVAYDLGGLSLKGDGRLGGSPATIDLRQPKGSPGEVAVAMNLDEAARSRRSLPVAPQLAGSVPVKIALPLGGKAPLRVEADLSRATVEGLLPGWSKPAGRPGKLTFTMADGEAADLRDIVLDSGPTQIRGGAVFGSDGALEKADLPVFKISQGDELKAQVDRVGGVYRVALRGNVGDARPVLKWMTAAPAGAASSKGRDGADFDLDLGVNILTGHNDETLTGVVAKISSRNREIRALQLRGQFRAAPFEAQILRRESGPPVIVATSEDAGAALRFLDLYKRMTGGALQVQASLGDVQSGSVTIERFVIKNEPALRRIAAQQSSPGGDSDDRTGNRSVRLDSDQVQFAKLTGGFRRSASRVEYKDVVVYGAQVGFNLSGFVDYGRDRTDIAGTFVPAYGLNNAFSQVPIVGLLLGGNKNEGLIAIDFRVSGAASAPTLTVNPLTVVAPGILRKLFGWAMPEADEPATTASPKRREN